jgi:hypothetical protein
MCSTSGPPNSVTPTAFMGGRTPTVAAIFLPNVYRLGHSRSIGDGDLRRGVAVAQLKMAAADGVAGRGGMSIRTHKTISTTTKAQ